LLELLQRPPRGQVSHLGADSGCDLVHVGRVVQLVVYEPRTAEDADISEPAEPEDAVRTCLPGNRSIVRPQHLGHHVSVTLNLGVLDQPYALGGRTTGEVATILETKYGIMAAFWRVHETENRTALEDSVAGAMETLLMSGRIVDPWARGLGAIETGFRRFISSMEAENVGIPNTPTYAALMGVSHRRKRPHAGGRGRRRPSFRDTGLYMASFRSWVD